MTENILILTVGLPRSGKSTWAKKTGFPIVNRDAIRLALHGQAYIQESEDVVTAIERYMVKSLFLAGHNRVVLDNCNLKFEYRKAYIKQKDWDTQVKVFNASKDICVERALRDDRPDLVPVIERMAETAGNLNYLVEGDLNYEDHSS